MGPAAGAGRRASATTSTGSPGASSSISSRPTGTTRPHWPSFNVADSAICVGVGHARGGRLRAQGEAGRGEAGQAAPDAGRLPLAVRRGRLSAPARERVSCAPRVVPAGPMLPVLFHFTFTSLWSQLLLYAVGAGGGGLHRLQRLARRARARRDPRATRPRRPRRSRRAAARAASTAAVGAALAWFGLQYALPAGAFPGGKGEGIPVHTYGVLLATGFISAVTVAARLAQDEWRQVTWVAGQGCGWTPRAPKREQVMDLAFWVLVGGLVGSRVLFVHRQLEGLRARLDAGVLAGRRAGLLRRPHRRGAGGLPLRAQERHGLPAAGGPGASPPCRWASAWGGWAASPPAAAGATSPARPLAAGRALPGRRAGEEPLRPARRHASSLAYQSQAQDTRYVVEATGQVLHQAAPGRGAHLRLGGPARHHAAGAPHAALRVGGPARALRRAALRCAATAASTGRSSPCG